jgi:hypothetical protein
MLGGRSYGPCPEPAEGNLAATLSISVLAQSQEATQRPAAMIGGVSGGRNQCQIDRRWDSQHFSAMLGITPSIYAATEGRGHSVKGTRSPGMACCSRENPRVSRHGVHILTVLGR